MKKIIIGLIVLNNCIFAVELERGYTGAEFGINTVNINTSNNNLLFDKYELIKANNRYLLKTLQDDNTDRVNIYKVAYNYTNISKSKGNGVNILYSYSPELEKRIGINLNYTNLKNKSKEDFGQANIFYNSKDYSDMTELFSTIYLGVGKDKDNKNIKLDSRFIGLYTKYTSSIDTYYDNFFPKVYMETDLKRLEIKKNKNIKNKKTKNDSINFGIGTELEKVVYENDLKISLIPKFSYNHEFLENRKYKYYKEKDYFANKAGIGLEVKAEYNEVAKAFVRYDYKKSINTSDYINIVSVGLKIML